MVLIQKTKKRPDANHPKTSMRTWIFAMLLAACSFFFMFYVTTFKPQHPSVVSSSSSLRRGGDIVEENGEAKKGTRQIVLLSTPNHTKITTDVRGNLGPAEVMLTDGTDWIKDRWQAASDMHGTAIQGHHEVLLSFHMPIQITSLVLDWEAAFSKDYLLEGAQKNLIWFPLYDTRLAMASAGDATTTKQQVLVLSSHVRSGQSPGVKTKTPLHIVDTFKLKNTTDATTSFDTADAAPTLQYIRLTIRSSAMGWGVSLWRIKVFGWMI